MMMHFNTPTVSWKQPQRNSKQHNKIPIQNILQIFWKKCSQMRNNCKCLSSAQCSLITIINAKAPPILGIQVFWDVMLCHWPSGFSRFEGSYCLQTKQKWTAMFGHRDLQKSIWLPQNDEKTQYHHTLSTPIKSSYHASGIRQFMYTSMSQTDFMSITRVLAQLSAQMFHMTNLYMNESKDICPWPRS